jgi:hypothetical protein
MLVLFVVIFSVSLGDADFIPPWLQSARASKSAIFIALDFQSPGAFENAGASLCWRTPIETHSISVSLVNMGAKRYSDCCFRWPNRLTKRR